ncbi:transcriptional repressor [Denitrificimonas sp. JX-1]|uniref:Transcriptional repressor n=1 Tax=Denitrificimonas halotolerans TaxID=3098930 RepID=A0ABU5GU27_9GAMM|nr:transcriptional repressor [Denitrificimonas sp. JX-1]MDY7220007.1 transcriptional repressor [Denitrificimonas sp. JX-1]
MLKKIMLCESEHHDHCISKALESAEEVCAQRGVRLTPLRKRVLELVWQSHKPLGAYDILDMLSRKDGRRAAPPTVYRGLDFLLENGLIHRLASLNAYIGCRHPEVAHVGYFMICKKCHNAYELAEHTAIDTAIATEATAMGFSVDTQMVEVFGACSFCRESA